MTAIQLINTAIEASDSYTLDELQQLKNKVHPLGNIVTGELMVLGWFKAMENLGVLIEQKQYESVA